MVLGRAWESVSLRSSKAMLIQLDIDHPLIGKAMRHRVSRDALMALPLQRSPFLYYDIKGDVSL